MTSEEQKRYINYLANRVNAADLENRAMKLVLQDFLDKQKADAERLAKLDDILSRVESLESSLKEKDRKIADLTAQLKFANKNRFGSSKHSTEKKKASPADESDRTRDEDDFDGTSSSNLQKTIHQVCLTHVKAKFDKASGLAGDRSADIFLQLIAFFYRRERQYDDEGLTPEERGDRRMDLETKEVLISLRQYLKIEKDKDPSETTPYLRAALNYLDKFWDNIFAFLKDGNLPIDNNLAGVSRGHYNMMLLAGIMEIFVCNYQRDEGRSLAIGLQEQVANHHKLRF